jgi:hypothetical protein
MASEEMFQTASKYGVTFGGSAYDGNVTRLLSDKRFTPCGSLPMGTVYHIGRP